MDLRQTPEYARYIKSLGWSVVGYRMSDFRYQIFVRKLPLLGNIGKLQRPCGKIDPKTLDKFAKKHKLVVLYVEPSLDIQFLSAQAGTIQDTKYKIHKSCFLPSKTIHIDLKLPEDELLNQMKKNTRYGIRSAQKKGVCVAQSKDINLFAQMWQKSARKRGMWFPLKKEIAALWNAFGKKTHILFAYNNRPIHDIKYTIHDTPIAGILLVRSPDTACYMYAFSTKEGNRLSAPTLLVWEAIKLAKRQGSKVFDFEGIYDARYSQTKNWKGFTRFKEGFGGKTITYPKTLARYYNPLMKLL